MLRRLIAQAIAAVVKRGDKPGDDQATTAPTKPDAKSLIQSAKGESDPPSKPTVLDKVQTAADVAGIADPTGAVDAINSALSFVRAFTAKDTSEQARHVTGGVIRGISAIPGGDVAKVGLLRQAGRVAKSILPDGSSSDASSGSEPQDAVEPGQPAAVKPSIASRVAGMVRFGASGAAQSHEEPQELAAAGLLRPILPSRSAGGASGERQSDTAPGANLGERIKRSIMDAFQSDPRTVDHGLPPRDQRPDPISPSEMISLAGKSPEEIQQIREERFRKQEEEAIQKKLREEAEQLAEKFSEARKNLVKMTTAVAAFPIAMKRVGELVMELRRGDIEFSGETASAFATADIEQRRLNMDAARATAPSTTDFVDAMREFRQATQPFRTLSTTVTNKVAEFGVNVATLLTKIAANTLPVQSISDWINGTGEAQLRDLNRGQMALLAWLNNERARNEMEQNRKRINADKEERMDRVNKLMIGGM